MARDFDRAFSGDGASGAGSGGLRHVAIAWYTKQTYDRCMALFDDAKNLHDTYEEWLASAQETERSCGQGGMKVYRAFIDPDTFPAWCKTRGYAKVNGKARSAYASEVARSLHRGLG